MEAKWIQNLVNILILMTICISSSSSQSLGLSLNANIGIGLRPPVDHDNNYKGGSKKPCCLKKKLNFLQQKLYGFGNFRGHFGKAPKSYHKPNAIPEFKPFPHQEYNPISNHNLIKDDGHYSLTVPSAGISYQNSNVENDHGAAYPTEETEPDLKQENKPEWNSGAQQPQHAPEGVNWPPQTTGGNHDESQDQPLILDHHWEETNKPHGGNWMKREPEVNNWVQNEPEGLNYINNKSGKEDSTANYKQKQGQVMSKYIPKGVYGAHRHLLNTYRTINYDVQYNPGVINHGNTDHLNEYAGNHFELATAGSKQFNIGTKVLEPVRIQPKSHPIHIGLPKKNNWMPIHNSDKNIESSTNQNKKYEYKGVQFTKNEVVVINGDNKNKSGNADNTIQTEDEIVQANVYSSKDGTLLRSIIFNNSVGNAKNVSKIR